MTDEQAAEIRSILQKGFARGLNFSECLAEVRSIFRTECPSRKRILDWYETVTHDNVELVKKLVEKNPKMTRQQIKARLKIGVAVVRSILRDRLGLRKIRNRWVFLESVEENGGDKNADVSLVKQESDFQIKSEIENGDLPESKDEFDDVNSVAVHNDEDFFVKKEIVDEDVENHSNDLTYLFTRNAIKEEPIDIIDEHIELDALTDQESHEFSESLENKDDLQERLDKKSSNTAVKSAIILTTDNRYTCKLCQKSYKSSLHAYRHLSRSCQISKRLFKCDKCGRNFTAKYSLKRHMLLLHTEKGKLPRKKIIEEETICHKCHKRYRDKYGLYRHKKYECGKEPQFACAHCEYRSRQKINLAKHLENIHAKSKMPRISCPKCDKSYKYEYSLKRHLLYECGKKPMACDSVFLYDVAEDDTIISFQDISNINEDSLSISDDQSDPLLFDSLENSDDVGDLDKKVPFALCKADTPPKVFDAPKSILKAIVTQKPRKPAGKFYLHNHLVLYCKKCDVTYEKIYGEKLTNCTTCKERLLNQCIACGKRYRNYCDITMHIKYNCGKPKRFTCIVCGYEARRKDQLKEHHKSQHQVTKEKPMVHCTKCDKAFKLERYRRWHEKHECDPKMIQKCSQCDFTTKYQSSLHSHVMNVHNRDESVRHACDECRKEFKSRSALLTHKRTKCGQDPKVQCAHCDYKTYQKYPLMVTHINRNHPDLFPVGEFWCKHCHKNMYHFYGLNKHLRASASCAEAKTVKLENKEPRKQATERSRKKKKSTN
ncbi:hypothetical protein TSAR_004768 [Trichomalopsis sarcophagae]|uniref:C2H2-type domain-containing protein n=1 Tax=Trichomalopsis sarcophagae TaxID=543379 RepID=A0A232ENS0_9HYME|nr:hypothetical protein TSAR_004768 [Trichomalopsis sarcophagae]